MPCNYFIDSERRLIISTASGVLTAAEAFAHQESLASDPGFHPEFNQVLDCTRVEKLVLNTEELRSLAKKNFFAPNARRALLVKGSLLYGLGRMLATFRDLAGGKEEMQIFQDREAAMKWLTDRSESPKLP